MNFANLLLNKNLIRTKKIYFLHHSSRETLKAYRMSGGLYLPSLFTTLHPYAYHYLSRHEPAWGRHNTWHALWKQSWINSSEGNLEQQNTRCHYRSHRYIFCTDSLKRPEVFRTRKTQGSPLCLTHQTQSPGLFQCPPNSLSVEAHTLQVQNLTLHQLSTEVFACLCFQVSTAPCDSAGLYGSTHWIFQGPRIRN